MTDCRFQGVAPTAYQNRDVDRFNRVASYVEMSTTLQFSLPASESGIILIQNHHVG